MPSFRDKYYKQKFSTNHTKLCFNNLFLLRVLFYNCQTNISQNKGAYIEFEHFIRDKYMSANRANALSEMFKMKGKSIKS